LLDQDEPAPKSASSSTAAPSASWRHDVQGALNDAVGSAAEARERPLRSIAAFLQQRSDAIDAKRAQRHAEALLWCNKAVTEAGLGPKEKAGRVLKAARHCAECQGATLLLVDSIRGELLGFSDADEVTQRFPVGEGVAGAVVASGHASVTPDACAVPIARSGAVVGVVECVRPRGGGFDARHGGALAEVAEATLPLLGELLREMMMVTEEEAAEDAQMAGERATFLAEFSRQKPAAAAAAAGRASARPRVSVAGGSGRLPKGVTLEAIRSWDFDPDSLGPPERLQLASCLLLDTGVLAAAGKPAAALRGFLAEVSAGYEKNAYHNWTHAVHVAHGCSMLLREADANPSPLAPSLAPLERLALLLSALGHDVGHPGTNNAFQVASSAPLALRRHSIA
jgi:hypothetical protein